MPERYELRKLLGKGGFGRVFLARFHGEAGFQKDVALKFLKPGARDDHQLIARLRDEARLLGLLQHRSIVQVDRLIRLQGAWVIVMEYVPGADLLDLLSRGPLPPGPALEIVYEVASALTAAYERTDSDGQALRLTHRDIKPGNIRLTGFGDVKVLDFGIARAEFAGQEAKGAASIVGTPAYMAPERFEGIDGPAGDVYGLGVVVCEMLTGARFGKVKSTRRAHRASVKEHVAQIRTVEGLPEGVAKLVSRMLHHDPTMRPMPAEVARSSRKFANRCALSLAEWMESAMLNLPAAGDSSDRGGPKTSIVVSGQTADLLQGSMMGAVPEELENLDLTGQLIGQSLTPDHLEAAGRGGGLSFHDDSSTIGDSMDFGLEPDAPSASDSASDSASASASASGFVPEATFDFAFEPSSELSPEPSPEPSAVERMAVSESESAVQGSGAPVSQTPDVEPRRGVPSWLVGLVLFALVLVVRPYLSDTAEPRPPGDDERSVGARVRPLVTDAVPPAANPLPSAGDDGSSDDAEGSGSEATPSAGDKPSVTSSKPDAGTAQTTEAKRAAATPSPPAEPARKTPKASTTKLPPEDKPPPAPPPAPPEDPDPPEATTTNTVRVSRTGDAQWVELVGANGRFKLPTQVPPGKYQIQVTFPGEASEPAGPLTVGKDPITVECESFFRQCSVK